MSSRSSKRADRIRQEVPLARVLADYGYRVRPGMDREQQFSCDLHGDGRDASQSARFYPDSTSYYCFACGASRDAIQLTREKMGLDFFSALKHLEAKYGLPDLPWSDDDREEAETYRNRTTALTREVTSRLEMPVATPDEVLRGLGKLLSSLTQDRDLDMVTTLKLWEIYDRLHYESYHESVTPEKVIQTSTALKEKIRCLLKKT